MPFLHTSAVRHWAIFMAVLLLLGVADILVLQPEFRDTGVLTAGVLAWATVFLAGLVAIGLYQGTRAVRLHRSH